MMSDDVPEYKIIPEIPNYITLELIRHTQLCMVCLDINDFLLNDNCMNAIDFSLFCYSKCRSTCSFFYRDVLAYVCGGAALFGILMSTCLTKFRYDTVPTGKFRICKNENRDKWHVMQNK